MTSGAPEPHLGLPPTWSGWTPTEGTAAREGKAAREAAAGGEGVAGLALLVLAAHGGLEDGEEIAAAGVEDCVAVLEGPLERADLLPRGGLLGGRGVLGRRRGRVEVGLLRLEGGGEERVLRSSTTG